MIHIRDLHFGYDDGGFGLQVDELAIGPGERVAWTGRSGSGKTTLLHLVAGILCPPAGRVTCCGTELVGLSDGARRDFRVAHIGLVLQDFALLDYLTVLDNILLTYRINRSLVLDETVRTRAAELAADVGLGDLLTRQPTHLSHGERQRIAVCRALIAQPKVILADEPTANLDEDNAMRVIDALQQHVHRQGATLIVVTHDLDLTSRFDRTIDVSLFCKQPEAREGGDGRGGSGNER